MKKFRVKVIEKVEKYYIVKAEDEEMAEECYQEGYLEHVEDYPYPTIMDIEDVTGEGY